MANSADPDQLASSEANWSGSTLFVKAGYIRVQLTRVKGNGYIVRGGNSVKIVFPPFKKNGVYYKGKEFAPQGEQIISF